MNSIVLTAAELVQVPSGVIVTPGDQCRWCHGTDEDPVFKRLFPNATQPPPPCPSHELSKHDDEFPVEFPVVSCTAGFVAPVRWTALEGPCETEGCEGGRVRDHIDQHEMAMGRGYGWHRCPNPDCVNGRKKVELRAPCDCHGDGECDRCQPGVHPGTGDTDYTAGSVLVAHCTIERIEPADNCQFVIHLADMEIP